MKGLTDEELLEFLDAEIGYCYSQLDSLEEDLKCTKSRLKFLKKKEKELKARVVGAKK